MTASQTQEPTTSSALRVALICFFAVGIVLTSAADYIGAGIEVVNHETTVRAGSSPTVIVWSIASLFMLALFLRYTRRPNPMTRLKWVRRVTAFALDFVAYLTSVAGLFALMPLVVEAKRVGQFHWSFSRTFLVWQDWFSMGLSTCVVLLLFLVYIAWPILHETQTVGGYVMRVAVVKDGPGTRSLRRCMVVALWYLLDIWASLFGWSLVERAGYKAVVVR